MELTQKASLTLSFFDWIVVSRYANVNGHLTHVRISDGDMSFLVAIDALNDSALNEEDLEDLAGHASSTSDAIYEAHEDWCQSWDGVPFLPSSLEVV